MPVLVKAGRVRCCLVAHLTGPDANLGPSLGAVTRSGHPEAKRPLWILLGV